MLVKYKIEGHLTLPEGTQMGSQADEFLLLNGQIITLKPSLEIQTSKETDDPHHIDNIEGAQMGVSLNNYECSSSQT